MNRIAHSIAAAVLMLVVAAPPSIEAVELTYEWALPTPQGNALHGLAFESSTIGYAVGTRGAVVRTTDGGVTWSDLSDFGAMPNDLRDVIALAPSSLLAVGAAPGIFRSTNAGISWIPVANPSTATLEDVELAAGSVLFAIGENGQVLRSTDGSGSWHVRTSPAPQTLKEQLWLSALDGIVVGEHVARRTTNGGATWSLLPGVTESQDFFNEVMQAAPGVFYAMADFHTAKTTNAGASWDWIFNPVFPVYRGKTIGFSADHLMMVTNLEGAEVWESTNGGVDWEERLQRFDLNGFTELVRRPDGVIHTCSTEGDLFRSTDDGATWSNATHSPDDEPRVTIAAIEILPGGRAYAGSTQPGPPETNWHRSDDAGRTWFAPPTAPPVFNVTDVQFWDDANGLVSGGVDSMARTTDGGDTWTTAPLPHAIPGGILAYQLSLPASGVAFCACDGANGSLVFRTTDFGATWEQRSTGIPQTTSWLGSVSFLSASTGFAAGGTTDQARVWKTTNGGGSWSQLAGVGLPNFLSGIHWFDETTGLASIHAASPGVYRTTNGGANWTQVFAEATMRMSFAGNFGVAVPQTWSMGRVHLTEDAGQSWEIVEMPADRAGTAVLAKGDGFLVGGYASQIVRATRADATGVPEIAHSTHDGALRLRGAPSVGRSVGLEWSVERGGAYRVDIVDVAGRRVRSLANGVIAPGESRTIAWEGRTDAGGLAAPGVYFARLAAGDAARAIRVQILR